MLQRASLCRALIHEPQLLMLDEPFGALDQFTREELWAIMQELWMTHRPTVLLVTHDLKEAGYLANRICVMQARPGRIIDDGAVTFPRPRTIAMTYDPEFVATDPAAARADRQSPTRPRRRSIERATAPPHRLGRPHHRLLRRRGKCSASLFGVKDIVLPRPSPDHRHALWSGRPRSWPHAMQTLYTTLVGFGLGIMIGVALGVADRLVAARL